MQDKNVRQNKSDDRQRQKRTNERESVQVKMFYFCFPHPMGKFSIFWENIQMHNDLTENEAEAESMSKYGRNFEFIWMHDMSENALMYSNFLKPKNCLSNKEVFSVRSKSQKLGIF